jgi:hypothetical protein
MKSVALQRFARLIASAVLACGAVSLTPAIGQDSKTRLEVHEWGVWIVDPNLPNANARERYVSAMPGAVSSVRSREAPKGEARLSPVSVLTFYGAPVAEQELSLQIQSGQFLAHWPTGESKNRRLRWPQLILSTTEVDQTGLAFVPDDHWFQQIRKGDSLHVRNGARTERFIAYDPELKFAVPFKIEGGAEQYRITNTSNWPLQDLAISAPEPAGLRVGWIDRVPASTEVKAKSDEPKTPPAKEPNLSKDEPKPTSEATATVEVAMSPLLAEDSPELESATCAALAERLARAGLKQQESELILAQYAKMFFGSRELVVIFRLPPDAMDELVPIELFPEAQKIVRVGLVLVRNIDPRTKGEVQDLIARLGDPKYSEREAAEKRLIELGAVAVPALKDALKNSDLEIVFRAERILLSRNEKIE